MPRRPAAEIIMDAVNAEQGRQGGGMVEEIHISPALFRRFFLENPLMPRHTGAGPVQIFGMNVIPMTRDEHEHRVGVPVLRARLGQRYEMMTEYEFHPHITGEMREIAYQNDVDWSVNHRPDTMRWAVHFIGPDRIHVESVGRQFQSRIQTQQAQGRAADWHTYDLAATTGTTTTATEVEQRTRIAYEHLAREMDDNIIRNIAGDPGRVMNERDENGAPEVRVDVGGEGIPGGEPGDVTPAGAD